MKKLTFFLITLCGIQMFSQILIKKDLAFGNAGVFTTNFTSNQNVIRNKILVMMDDSILQIVSLPENDYILKIKPNGTLDLTFADRGRLELGSNNFLNAVQQNDKIIIYFGPKSLDYSNYLDSKIVRYNSNGTLDSTFGTNGVVNEITESTNPQALSVLVLADQSLVVTNSADSNSKKYTKDGRLDTCFGNHGEIIYNYQFPVAQFTNGKIATCNINSLSSSVFSFFDLNSLTTNSVLDLNNFSCHQLNNFTIQNKTNISTRAKSDGTMYSVFEYQNNPLPNFSRLIVMKSEKLDPNFNNAGFVTSNDEEQFLDAGLTNNMFFVLNQKANQRALNGYLATGNPIKINKNRDFPLLSGDEIEVRDHYILVNSTIIDDNQNLVKIEKFLISEDLLITQNINQKKARIENPMKDFLKIENAENADLFELLNMEGRIIAASKNYENLSIASLAKGNYLLKIHFQNGSQFSQKLIKQ